MADTRDQTLTQVQSPLSPGEAAGPGGAADVGQREHARARGARAACRSSATSCTSAGAPTGCPCRRTSRCWTTGWCPASTRASCAASGGYDLEDLGSKNGTLRRQRPRRGPHAAARRRAGVRRQPRRRVPAWCRRSSSRRSRRSWSRRWDRWRPRRRRWRWRAIGCDGWPSPRASCSSSARPAWARRSTRAPSTRRASARGRFVAINCAAIPRELVESELFGYRAGAHSTAHPAKAGLIEEAEGGTLFLDEIGEMTPEAQIKILRFLQDRELTPLGSTRPRRMDVRIIAATNRTVVGPGQVGAARRHRRAPGRRADPPAAAAQSDRGPGRADRAFSRRRAARRARASSSPRSARCRCTPGRSTCASWRRSSRPRRC